VLIFSAPLVPFRCQAAEHQQWSPSARKPEGAVFQGGGVRPAEFGRIQQRLGWLVKLSHQLQHWLVVWNMIFIFPYIGNHNSN
jgi:hypothetical protein